MDSMKQIVNPIIAYLPYLIAGIIILIIGWIIGRLLEKFISKVLDNIGVDDALRKTVVGKAIEQSGTSIVHLFDLIIRWFV